MSAHRGQALWQQLCDAGLAQGDLPADVERSTPWFIRAMLGVAGWIGAIFLLAFVGGALAFVFRSESAAIFTGAGCCAAAYAIFRVGGRSDLVAQFGLALSVAGQVMIGFGLYESTNGGTAFYAGLAIVEAVLALALHNFVNRVCSTLIAGLMLGYALRDLGLPGVGPGLIAFAVSLLWRTEQAWARQGHMFRAMGYGLAIALVFPDFSAMFTGWRGDVLVLPMAWTVWIKPVLIGAALVYTVHQLLSDEQVPSGSMLSNAALAATAGIAIVALRAPGITASLLLVLIGFARGNRALLGVGIAAMLWYLSYFYYALHMSLLWKSFALVMTGVTLLLLWGIARRLFGAADDAPAPESANA